MIPSTFTLIISIIRLIYRNSWHSSRFKFKVAHSPAPPARVGGDEICNNRGVPWSTPPTDLSRKLRNGHLSRRHRKSHDERGFRGCLCAGKGGRGVEGRSEIWFIAGWKNDCGNFIYARCVLAGYLDLPVWIKIWFILNKMEVPPLEQTNYIYIYFFSWICWVWKENMKRDKKIVGKT